MSDTIEVDADTGEVLPATIEQQPPATTASYRAELVYTPEAARGMMEQMRQIQREVLRENVDYAVIPGTNKPSLLKPGAESLLRMFGLGCNVKRTETREITKDDGTPGIWYAYVATVTRSLPNGHTVTVSECEGCAGHDEPKWRKAPSNTIMKMAQKRAFVGAALIACGASDLFTQDVEDYGEGQSFGGGGGGSYDDEEVGPDTVMPFGKHKGEKLRDVPVDYLEWMAKNGNKPAWKDGCAAEVVRRQDAGGTAQATNNDDEIPF